jgi:hypothetical protein
VNTQELSKQEQIISIPSAWDLEWTALDSAKHGNPPGPVWKVLRTDEKTGGQTYVMHLPPGWILDALDWHPGSEEGFFLAGVCEMPDNHMEKGCYLYRPPGILHGPAVAPSLDGATMLQRMSGELLVLPYDGDEFPHEHLQPITDQYKDWPIEWNEHLDTNTLPWEPVTAGGWAGTSVKWVQRNTETGGGAVLLQIPVGWKGQGSPALGPIQEFVVEGSYTAGDQLYGTWGYSFRPAGLPAGTYSSEEGALLFCWWDEANECAESAD